jgi:hypothetical protein
MEVALADSLGFVYFSGIFTLERCEDVWGFGVYPILSNILKYSSPKILYHDGEFFLSSQKYTRVEGIYGDIPGLSPQNPD